MKKLNYLMLLSVLWMTVSCAVKVPMNEDYLQKPGKVGIFVNVTEPQKYREGSQGLLDLAVTSGDKYQPLLDYVKGQINPKQDLITLYVQAMRDRGQEVVVIDEGFDAKNASKFKGEKAEGKKYSTYDLGYLKNKYNVDNVIFVNMNWGIMVSYYSMIETGRAAFAYIDTKVVNLDDQSLYYSNPEAQSIVIKGKWNTPPAYENAAGKIREAVDKTIEAERKTFMKK